MLTNGTDEATRQVTGEPAPTTPEQPRLPRRPPRSKPRPLQRPASLPDVEAEFAAQKLTETVTPSTSTRAVLDLVEKGEVSESVLNRARQ